jgi:hypothetical protein
MSEQKKARTVKTAPFEKGFHLDQSAEKPSEFPVQPPLVSLSGTGAGLLQFVSDDWSDYADLSKLPRRSGVPSQRLRRLVLKELADNGLDECDRVNRPGRTTISKDGPDVYTVTDEGEGLNGSPGQIASFFSLCRPKATSKLWRLPKRGAVGNGVRVIVGAVASGGGRINIQSRGQTIVLRPQAHNGSTLVEEVSKSERLIGTAITIEINPACPVDEYDLVWAETAIRLAQLGDQRISAYRANPHWLDLDHFREMLRSITAGTSVRDFVAQLDGCSSSASRTKITQQFGTRRLCSDLKKEEAAELLGLLQTMAKPQKAKNLPLLGKTAWDSHAYYKVEGEFVTGDRLPHAIIVFVVECWAKALGRDSNDVGIRALTINRSPAIGTCAALRGYGRGFHVDLCGTTLHLDAPEGSFTFALNITSPFVPVISEGKLPDLDAFSTAAADAIQTALRRASKYLPEKKKAVHDDDDDDDAEDDDEEKPPTQRAMVWKVIPAAIERSRNDYVGFGQRDLYYSVRLLIQDADAEVTFKYFGTILTDYENEVGPIEDMHRDARGFYVEPHGGEMTPMGTVTVAQYERPAWAYSNFLFLEKEDFVAALNKSGFLDRWDCFACTSKGFTTRAAKDLLDKIALKKEPTNFWAAHDADASGSLIHQTLVQETKTRGARLVNVIELGLFPWDALRQGLLKEPVKKKRKKNSDEYYWRPVADYIKERDEADDEEFLDGYADWEDWLQDWRVELNSMTKQEFIVWMDEQFTKYGASKVIPPEDLVAEQLEAQIQNIVHSEAQAEVEEEHREEIDELQEKLDALLEEIKQEASSRSKERLDELIMPTGPEAVTELKEWLGKRTDSHWTAAIPEMAQDFIDEQE